MYARKDKLGNYQGLLEHLGNVADLMGEDGKLLNVMKLIGVLHDLGKSSERFQRYLIEGDGKRGSVIHSLQGARFILEFCPMNTSDGARLLREFLALVVSHHHGRLPDCVSFDGRECFIERLRNRRNDDLDYSNVLNNSNRIFRELNIDIEDLFNKASSELDELLDKVFDNIKDINSQYFAFGLIAKYLYSYLIDADRLDAFLFESKVKTQVITPKWDELLKTLEVGMTNLCDHGKISMVRNRISSMCKEASVKQSGVYELTVPTGGGKTLSSLRFALTNAQRFNKKRIIYVIPYLSIIDQTAHVIKEQLKLLDNNNILLEDHSNAGTNDTQNSENERLENDYLQASWNKPIILTTMVNFLETVMTAKGGKLRKFKNMQDSIIIFDEIQSLPVHSINLFNEVVSFLAKVMNSIVLLCTATQPKLELVGRKNLLLEQNHSLVKLENSDFSVFNRTYIELLPKTDLTGLCDFVAEKSKNEPSIVVIVNTKKSAKDLFCMLNDTMPDTKVFHLSTNLCPKNRFKIINDVKNCLNSNQRLVLITTKLIEAGVDLSFSCAVRCLAGFDSIVQVAGRCNRNGEFGQQKPVYVVPLTDENLGNLADIELGKKTSERVFNELKGNDYSLLKALDLYYKYYFDEKKESMDFCLKNGAMAYQLLSTNSLARTNYKNIYGKKAPCFLAQGFESVDDEYCVISKNTEAIIVDYEDSLRLVERLKTTDIIKEKVELARKLSKYSIEVYKGKALSALYEKGLITFVDEDLGLKLLSSSCYDDKVGIKFDGGDEFLTDSS